MISRVAVVLSASLALSGCAAVYAWDTMQVQSARKNAIYKLMAECDAGDAVSCAYVAGVPTGAVGGD